MSRFSAWKISTYALLTLVVLSIVAFVNSHLWVIFFEPSSIVPALDPGVEIDKPKLAFMAQQPYQGYYGAWIQFASACLATIAATAAVFSVVIPIRAEDRRARERRQQELVALAFALRAECRQVIDQIPALQQRAESLKQHMGRVSGGITAANAGPLTVAVDFCRPIVPDTLTKDGLGHLGGQMTESAYYFRSKLLDVKTAVSEAQGIWKSLLENVSVGTNEAAGQFERIADELRQARERGLALKTMVDEWLKSQGVDVPRENP